MAKRRVVAWLAGMLLIVSLTALWLRNYLRVDACLDRGGRWNAVKGVCELLDSDFSSGKKR